MAVPYTFGSATTSIPLSQLDSNFATAITLGNTAVQLGNTITSLTGVTNVSSGSSLTLGSNNTARISIASAGYVGVNNTNPVGLGQLEVQATSTGAALWVQTGGTTNSYTVADFRTGTNAPALTIFGNATSVFNSTVGVGGATAATSGAGISFPATQSASSDANTLDDYEEGTFTPTIIGKTSAGTGTYSNQTGSYIKVGQIVSIFIRMDWSAHTGTGNMGFGGLPFTSAGTFANGAAVNGMAGMTVTASCYVAANVDASSTTGSFLAIPVGGGNDSPLAMDVSAILLFTITYRASA